MNLSSALEFSSRPPVSVYGTGRNARFSWRQRHWIIDAAVALSYYRLRFNVLFRQHAPTKLPRHFCRIAGSGILTACPSTAPSGFVLGPD